MDSIIRVTEEEEEESMIRELSRELQDAQWPRRLRSQAPTIYRIPGHMRDGDPKSYEPALVAVGPYHRDNDRLKAMDKLKWLYLKDFLLRNPGRILDHYVTAVRRLQDKAVASYSERPTMVGTQFVQMLLLDGCFILEMLMKTTMPSPRTSSSSDDDEYEKQDPIRGTGTGTGTTWANTVVVRDMLLLENQIPFIVLQTLFDVYTEVRVLEYTLVDLAMHFFYGELNHHHQRDHHLMTTSVNEYSDQFHHLLHLYHHCFTFTNPNPNPVEVEAEARAESVMIVSSTDHHETPPPSVVHGRQSTGRELIPSATELADAGVKFTMKAEAASPVDITFQRASGIMEIPQLHIFDETYSIIIRNMIAFEQLIYQPADRRPANLLRTNVVMSYAKVMEALIKTPEDVALLRREGIIVNELLGDDGEAAKFFSQLCNKKKKAAAAVRMMPRYDDLIKKVNKHYDSRINRWQAKLKRYYFRNPWTNISVVAAAAASLLFLTATQTIFANKSYNHSSRIN